MKIFEYIDRLKRIHTLIQLQQTGTPLNLAKKIGISTSQLYNIIEELKFRGAPIAYSRTKKRFYYKTTFEMNINYEFKTLSDEEKIKYDGGSIYSFSPIFMECKF